jgi:hypothetical protein
MMKICSDPERTTTFPKNVALITAFSKNDLTLRQLKALHTIVLAVREQFFLRNPHIDSNKIKFITERDVQQTNTTFDILEEDVMTSMGYTDKKKYYSYSQILAIFEQIADATIGFDGLGIVRSRAERDHWTGFCKVLGQVERIDGYFRLNVPPKMVHSIVNPEISFRGPVSWGAYRTKFTPGLYEICLYYWQKGESETDWFDLELLKRITGSSSSTYDDYNKFRTRVLDKTLDVIKNTNELDLRIVFEEMSMASDKPIKAGRKKITHIRFRIFEKVQRLADCQDVRNGIVFSSVKTELESLGIARNLISDVVAECHGQDDKPSFPFLKWCIRKGHELRQLTYYAQKPAESSEKTKHNFGGYLRKHIIRARKEEWFIVNKAILNLIEQKGGSRKKIFDLYDDSLVSEVKASIKSQIATTYIKSLTDPAFAHLKETFVQFLEEQLPQNYIKYNEGLYGDSLVDMAANSEFCLFIFLDYRLKIFTADSYLYCISKGQLPNLIH